LRQRSHELPPYFLAHAGRIVIAASSWLPFSLLAASEPTAAPHPVQQRSKPATLLVILQQDGMANGFDLF